MGTWNYNMNQCPLNTRVKLLSENDFPILPQMEFEGTIIRNNEYLTRGKCLVGDPDYFYRSKIIAFQLI